MVGVGSKPIIRIESISKRFGSVAALESVSLEIARGDVVAIIGPSGSGKSTLCRCINGIEHADTGNIFIEDELLPREGTRLAEIRADLGMVFQAFNLFPHMTILENITLGPIRVRGRSKDAAEDAALQLLEKVGIADRAKMYPAQLSGGQQQRAAIARSLAMTPKAILFDEPTSALDPELVSGVLGIMKDLAREGMTMVVVTHEIAFAREVADQIVFMDRGRLVEQAPPGEFFTETRSERARQFLSQLM